MRADPRERPHAPHACDGGFGLGIVFARLTRNGARLTVRGQSHATTSAHRHRHAFSSRRDRLRDDDRRRSRAHADEILNNRGRMAKAIDESVARMLRRLPPKL
jgi:hypothetical protein